MQIASVNSLSVDRQFCFAFFVLLGINRDVNEVKIHSAVACSESLKLSSLF